jgi:hypothetical protein
MWKTREIPPENILVPCNLFEEMPQPLTMHIDPVCSHDLVSLIMCYSPIMPIDLHAYYAEHERSALKL